MLKRLTFAACGMLAIAPSFAANKEQNHNDAFIPGAVNENQIAKEVRHQLVALPYYGVFDDLAFRLDGSKVVLLGAVTRPTLKSDAEKVTKGVSGVTSVVNDIEVLPLSPMDDQIRRAAYRAIYGDPTLSDRYGFQAIPSIHILVKNGNIVLEGVVANEFDRNVINVKLHGVPGAFAVQNDLQIEAKSK